MSRRVLLHVALPIFLGGAFYLLLRRDDVALFRAVDAIGLGRALDALRITTRAVASSIPRPISGSAPDAAWAYAFGAATALVWRGDRSRAARFWLASGFAIAILIEIAQAPHWIPGVFDPIDLVAIAAAYAFGVGSASPRSARSSASAISGDASAARTASTHARASSARPSAKSPRTIV